MTLEELRKEYVGKWFLLERDKYLPYLPIEKIEEIPKMLNDTQRERVGKILDLNCCYNSFEETQVVMIEIKYKNVTPNFTEENSIYVSYKNFLNNVIFGDTSEELWTNYKLKKEIL